MPHGGQRPGGQVPRRESAGGGDFSVAVADLPVHYGVLDIRGPVVAHLGPGLESLAAPPQELLQARQRDRSRTETPELLRLEDALGAPEGVEQAHQRLALAGIVLQLEELEPGQRRPHRRLDLFLVQLPGEAAGGPLEVGGLLEHSVLGQPLAVELQAAGPERPGVAGQLAVVRVRHPLADLVRNHRRGNRLGRLAEIPRRTLAEDAPHAAPLCRVGDVDVVLGHVAAGGRASVEPPRIPPLRLADHPAQ